MLVISLFLAISLVNVAALNVKRLSGYSCPASYNHIPNGGFQTGTFDDWAPLDLSTGFNVSIIPSVRSPDGYACRGSPIKPKHRDNDYFGITYNTVYACEDVRYKLSYWYRFHGDHSACSLSVEVPPKIRDVRFKKAVAGQWYHNSFTFDQVRGTNSTLWVQWYCFNLPQTQIDSTYIDIDDFSITKVANLTNPACPIDFDGIRNGGFEEGTLNHWGLHTVGTTHGQVVQPGFNGSAYALRVDFHNASSDTFHGFTLRHQVTQACTNATYDYSFSYRYVNNTSGKIPARLEVDYRILSDACFGFLSTSLEWRTVRGSCQAMFDSVPVKENLVSFRLHYAKPQKSFSDFAIEFDGVDIQLRS